MLQAQISRQIEVEHLIYFFNIRTFSLFTSLKKHYFKHPEGDDVFNEGGKGYFRDP